jgi:O-acetyl-ADP-ribose deacetylase (regulator of RNase III)
MIRLVIGDITKLQVDAIVNAANSQLMPCGGVDGAIHQAAGPGLFSELKTHHTFLQPGEAILTAGYRLPAKHVIHTVAPRWIPGLDNQTEILSDCYRNSIRLALENDFESIAFPALGTGAFGIPKEVAMSTALSAIALQLQRSGPELDVTICCYTEDDYQFYVEAVSDLGGDVLDDGTLLINQLLPKCPICFHPLKRIVYGMPSPDMLENQDNIYIGGCTIMGGDPEIGCKNCDWQGFIGDVDLVESEWFALVVDRERERFVAGAFYHAGRPDSALTLRHGIAEFQQGFTTQWLDEQIASCKEPSFWLGERGEIMSGALEQILLRYPTLTEEVMAFAGFIRVLASPRLEIRPTHPGNL